MSAIGGESDHQLGDKETHSFLCRGLKSKKLTILCHKKNLDIITNIKNRSFIGHCDEIFNPQNSDRRNESEN